MSVDIHDLRRFNKTREAEKEPEHVPILQVDVESNLLTNDPRFDKLIRALSKKVQDIQVVLDSVAHQLPSVLDEKEIRKGQLIYANHRGLIDAYKDVMTLPAQILAEEKMK